MNLFYVLYIEVRKYSGTTCVRSRGRQSDGRGDEKRGDRPAAANFFILTKYLSIAPEIPNAYVGRVDSSLSHHIQFNSGIF